MFWNEATVDDETLIRHRNNIFWFRHNPFDDRLITLERGPDRGIPYPFTNAKTGVAGVAIFRDSMSPNSRRPVWESPSLWP